MVLYCALYDCPYPSEEYGEQPLFVRPYDMFMGKVYKDGKKIKRFVLIEEKLL